MPMFQYRAGGPDGRRVRGVEDAATADALEARLLARRLYPVKIQPVSNGARQASGRRRLTGRAADVAESMATLASLVEAGLTLDRALEVASRGATRPDTAKALDESRRRLRAGEPLAATLRDHPRLFPPVALGMVQAGERGGHLGAALRRLATHLEHERLFRGKVMSAMIYPTVLTLVGGATLALLLIWVLPRFIDLLADAGADVPATTALLLTLAATAGRIWPVMLMLAAAGIASVALLGRSLAGRRRLHALLLRLPAIGGTRAARAGARFSRTLATLLASGMPLVPALRIAADACGDAALAAELGSVEERVRRGEDLSVALAASFPETLVRLTEVGEQGGRLDAMLERAAALLERDVERRLERFGALVEPALIVVFGLAVGFVALSLLQSVYGVHGAGF